jgi:hypothetical protein
MKFVAELMIRILLPTTNADDDELVWTVNTLEALTAIDCEVDDVSAVYPGPVGPVMPTNPAKLTVQVPV